ncbi:hypothetical protein JOC85_003506 [Bacillus mesophilus]|uniref:XRE family transcriptional regulator n=1 Tax=Bacillus mesophilus TaxID=1808955 RepID=A0A6M0QA78_9BACI|nr:hypothetical protein [Bacillus mesophilus]MBM7662696.1 hypothetical protein [Bacillus mesophilus]NEY73242.1 hypothetical protein [Bacillus mesophilus]
MLDQRILTELEEFIHLHINAPLFSFNEAKSMDYSINEEVYHSEIDDFINTKRKETVSQLLFKLIDQRGVSDTEVYKKAGIDRRHFSKIRSNPSYRPGKNTMILLALALELNLEETEDWLAVGGYSLSDSDTGDLVVQFCINKKIYDLDFVNEALDHYDLKTL